MDTDENVINNFANALRNHHVQRTVSLYSENRSRGNTGTEKYEIKDVILGVAKQLKAIQNADNFNNRPSGKGIPNQVKKSSFLPVHMVPVEQPPKEIQSHKFETQCILDTQLINIIDNAEAIIDAEKGITQEFDTTFCHKDLEQSVGDELFNISQKPSTLVKDNGAINNKYDKSKSKDTPDCQLNTNETNLQLHDCNIIDNKIVKHIDAETGMIQEFDTIFSYKDLDIEEENHNVQEKNMKNDNIQAEDYRESKCVITADTLKTKNEKVDVFLNKLSLKEERAIADITFKDLVTTTNTQSSTDVCDNFDTQCKFYFDTCEDDSAGQNKELINSTKSIVEEPKSPILNKIRHKEKSNTPSPLIFELETFEKFETFALPVIENHDFETAKRVINSQILNRELFIYTHAEAVLSDRDKDIQMKSSILESGTKPESSYGRYTNNKLHLKEDSMLFSSDEENDVQKDEKELPLTCTIHNSFYNEPTMLEKTMYVGFQTASNKSIQISTDSYCKAKSIFDNIENIQSENLSERNVEALGTIATTSNINKLEYVNMNDETNNNYEDIAHCFETGIGETINVFEHKDTISNSVDRIKNNSKNHSDDVENLPQLYDSNDRIKHREDVKDTSKSSAGVKSSSTGKTNNNSFVEHSKFDDHILEEFNTDLILEIALNKIDNLTKGDINDFVGFKTANNKMIKISSQALMKTKNIFENIDSDDNLQRKSEKQSFKNLYSLHRRKSETISTREITRNICLERPSKSWSSHTKAPSNLKLINASNQNNGKNKEDLISADKTDSRITIPKQAYDKMKATFQNIDSINEKSDNFEEKLFYPVQNIKSNTFQGFTTASNKPVKLSTSALDKTKNIFEHIDIENNVRNDNFLKILTSADNSVFQGFKTANNKSIPITMKQLAKSKDIFQDIFDTKAPNDEFSNYKDETSILIDSGSIENAQLQAFETPSNIKISKEALLETKKFFQNINFENRNENNNDTIAKAISLGFKRVANKPKEITSDAFSKSKKIFQGIDDEENIIVKDSDKEQPYPIAHTSLNTARCQGFKTAANKSVGISIEALAKSKKIFQNIDAEEGNIVIDSDSIIKVKQPYPIVHTSLNNAICQGFKTAANKAVRVSAEALAKSKKIFQNIDTEERNIVKDSDNISKEKQPYPIAHTSLNTDICQGFKTAANKPVGISAEALAKSKKIFQNIDTEERNIVKDSDNISKEKQPYPIAHTSLNTDICQGFKTAANKPVGISAEALAKSKKIFQNIDTEERNIVKDSDNISKEKQPYPIAHTSLNTDICQGFKTAANKPEGISAEALAKSKKIFQNIDAEKRNIVKDSDNISKEKQPYPIAHTSLNTDIFQGFKTAAKKPVGISAEALAKSKKIFQNIDSEEKIIVNDLITVKKKQLYPIPHTSQNDICQGFKTAGNMPVEISEDALAKSKKIFENMDKDCEIKQISGEKVKKRPKIVPKNQLNFVGFDTASNKKVKVSEKALLQSRQVPQNANLDLKNENCSFVNTSHLNAHKIKATEKSVINFGFKTGNNTQINISEEALKQSKNIFSDLSIEANADSKLNLDNVISEKDILEDFNTEIIKDFEDTVYTEDFIKNETPKSKRSGSPILSCPKSKKRKKFETPIMIKKIVAPINRQSTIKTDKTNVYIFDENYKKIKNYTLKDLNEIEKVRIIKDVDSYISDFRFEALLDFEFIGDRNDIDNDRWTTDKIKGYFTDSVNKRIIPEGWIENHLKMIIWKLVSYEIRFPGVMKNVCTVKNVLEQLKYRYKRELYNVERPVLRKILEKDEVSSKLMILCVAGLFVDGVSVCSVTNHSQNIELLLTDGWYAIKAFTDRMIDKLVREGKISVGTKLVIHGAELLNCEQGIAPWEDTSSIRLKISGNSTRRAKWDARLGVHGNGTILSRLSAVKPEGGRVSQLRTLVTRVYPTLYIEKFPDGSTLTRSERLEHIYQMKYETERQIQMEKLYDELERFSDQITDDDYVCEACWELSITAVNQNLQQNISTGDEQAGSSQRGHVNVCLLCGCSTARRQSDIILRNNPTELQQNMINIIQRTIEPRQESQDSEGQCFEDRAMESGSQISRLMKKSRDRDEFRANLTSSQAHLLQQHSLKQKEKLIQALQDKFQELVKKRGLDTPRNVVPLMKIRVADVENTEVTKAMVTIWKPNETLQEMLAEGTWIDLFNVVPTSVRYSEIQISAGRQSVFRKSKLNETDNLKTLTKTLRRQCYTTKDLQNPSMNTDYNEVDTVGLIFMMEPQTLEFETKNQLFQNVYLTDENKNIICVNFWGGIKKFGFQNILDTGQIVACVNLQKRAGNTRKSIPQYRATEFTYFTKTPKNDAVRKLADDLTAKFSTLDKRKFIDDCVALKNNYHNFKCGNTETVSPYRLNTSDYNVYKNKVFIDSPLVNKCTDVNFNLTGLDFESSFKQSDTQDLSPQMLLRKRKVNEKIAKLKMYGEPPPLSPIHLINKSSNAVKAFKSPLTKNDISTSVASPASSVPQVQQCSVPQNKENKPSLYCQQNKCKDGESKMEFLPQNGDYKPCVTSTNALPQNRVDVIDSSPVLSVNRTYVKKASINPVKLNFSNAIETSITDAFAEDFDGSPPLSLDADFVT